MPRYTVNIKRNSIQTLVSCIPGCFRLAQKYFVRIEDVVSKSHGTIPTTLIKPGPIDSFNINRVSWTYIWNEIHPRGTDRKKRILPIISDNRFIGHITYKDSMDWCPRCWDYFPRGSHTEHRDVIKPILYMQSPARVEPHLVPEFSSGSLYQIIKDNNNINFQNKNEILTIFEQNKDEFDALLISIIEVNTNDFIDIYANWINQYPRENHNKLRNLREQLGDTIHDLINWALNNLVAEGFKRITHSTEVAKKEGKKIYSSTNININYSNDMNIIRYVYEIERCPIGEPNTHSTRFSDMNTLNFRSHQIDCIASSSRVECLVVCFNKNINRLTSHTYIHALTLYLSKKFKISKEIISHHIDNFFAIIFINQPINLGLLANITKENIEEFHTNYCNGENNCQDRGVCPGACHHCLHFPYYSCPEPDEMENLNWNLLRDLEEW
jgi:hypothetical protein